MKIKATWTKKMIKDLKSMHGIDISAHMEGVLVNELQNRRKRRKEKIESILRNNDKS